MVQGPAAFLLDCGLGPPRPPPWPVRQLQRPAGAKSRRNNIYLGPPTGPLGAADASHYTSFYGQLASRTPGARCFPPAYVAERSRSGARVCAPRRCRTYRRSYSPSRTMPSRPPGPARGPPADGAGRGSTTPPRADWVIPTTTPALPAAVRGRPPNAGRPWPAGAPGEPADPAHEPGPG